MELTDYKSIREIGYKLDSVIVEAAHLRFQLISNSKHIPDYLTSEAGKNLKEEIKLLDLKYHELKEQKLRLLEVYEITIQGNLITTTGIKKGHSSTYTFHSNIDCKMTAPDQIYWGHPNFTELFLEIHAKYASDYEYEGITITAIKQLQ